MENILAVIPCTPQNWMSSFWVHSSLGQNKIIENTVQPVDIYEYQCTCNLENCCHIKAVKKFVYDDTIKTAKKKPK